MFVPHSCLLWRGTVLVAGTEFWGYLVRPRRTGTGPQSHRCLLPSGRTALPNPPDVLWHICRGNGLKKAEGKMCHINDLTLCLKHLRLIFSAAHFHTLPHGSNISLWNQINLLLNLISKQGFWLQIISVFTPKRRLMLYPTTLACKEIYKAHSSAHMNAVQKSCELRFE